MFVEYSAYNSPATPASAPAIRNVNEIVRFTLMPIIAAASWSCAVARIALPWRVFWTSQMRRNRIGNVVTATIRLDQRYALPPIVNTAPVGRMFGTDTGAGPRRL